MKNPLRKRLLRELKDEFGKYLVIFILMLASIGFVSGFLVADGSMIKAYNESFEKYNIENGHFRTSNRMNRAQIKAVEACDISVYELFYADVELSNDSTMRLFAPRREVNGVCLMEGDMPSSPDEIAIDRMYADNNTLSVGDTLTWGSRELRITGLVALSDYSCLFSDNADSMFDSIKFGVGIVTDELFSAISEKDLNWCYAWKYAKEPADEQEEHEVSEALLEKIAAEVSLEEFVPRYQCQAIMFTGEDMGSDEAMMTVLLYIIIVIMAFVFGITINNTITKEANVIGTLRASGYTKGELIRHYMSAPILVTLIGAVVGNILGYTVVKDVCADMYYGSYSLPTYVTIWSAEAFLKTTVIPILLMLAINYIILNRKLRLEPLKFLRRDLSTGKRQKRALPLSRHIPFFTRFRFRVIFQNMPNYVMLFIGIVFANLLLAFGMIFPSILENYEENMPDNMLCSYQYMLQLPIGSVNEEHKLETLLTMLQFQSEVETENEDAEKFSAYSLNTTSGRFEEILFYGIDPGSRYIDLDVSGGQVYISSAYADKYEISPGDTITLKEQYGTDEYSFVVDGIYYYEGALTVFMGRELLNKTFDMDEDTFAGYFSDTEITDIDEKYISTVIDLEALTKISRQLMVSMGSMMYLVDGFAVGIFIVLIYLLSKIIIEKNAQSISMVKILGYSNREISRLYILSTSLVVVLCILLSIPIEYEAMLLMVRVVLVQEMNGWLTIVIEPVIWAKMVLIGMATYAVVAALEFRRIRKVPMDAALKNVE